MSADDPHGDRAFLAARRAQSSRLLSSTTLSPDVERQSLHGVRALGGKVWDGRRFVPAAQPSPAARFMARRGAVDRLMGINDPEALAVVMTENLMRRS